MAQILVITENPSHTDDLRSLLGDAYDTVTLNEVDASDVTNVSGSTLVGTAMRKAANGAVETDLVTVAEAYGIYVHRLDGAPGVLSSIYAGPDATDEDNREFLLQQLRDAPGTGRAAQLVSVVSVAAPDGYLQTFDSTLEGAIAESPRGIEGVGYEPIFELDDGMTIAELLPEQRNNVRPRALALQKAIPFLDELLKGR